MLSEQEGKNLPDTLERILDNGIVIDASECTPEQGIDLISTLKHIVVAGSGGQGSKYGRTG